MKKVIIVLLALSMVLMGLSAQAAGEKAAATTEKATTLTLWTYPIGDWGTDSEVRALMDAFTAETGIEVEVEYLTYTDGDDKVNTALAAGQAPDLIKIGRASCRERV